MNNLDQKGLQRQLTYEEERTQAYAKQAHVGKQKLSKMMIIVVATLEISAMGGMAYLVYLMYFR